MKKINSSSSIIAVQYMEEEHINDGTQLELKKKINNMCISRLTGRVTIRETQMVEHNDVCTYIYILLYIYIFIYYI